MIDKILNLRPFPSSFSIEGEKKKFKEHGGTLPEYFEDKVELSKDEVIKIIRDERHTLKDEFLAILFWGKYFEVITTTRTINSLVRFVESKSFDKLIEKRKDTIMESDDAQALFQKFRKKCKIPGLDYA
jgi:hypothetical protein